MDDGVVLREFVNNETERRFLYWCPACRCSHEVRVKGPDSWGWSGNMEKPTFTPSILALGHRDDKDFRCHSFITGGQIQFLDDCTHELRGQTVPMVRF